MRKQYHLWIDTEKGSWIQEESTNKAYLIRRAREFGNEFGERCTVCDEFGGVVFENKHQKAYLRKENS